LRAGDWRGADPRTVSWTTGERRMGGRMAVAWMKGDPTKVGRTQIDQKEGDQSRDARTTGARTTMVPRMVSDRMRSVKVRMFS
jgi:hypothetical protein